MYADAVVAVSKRRRRNTGRDVCEQLERRGEIGTDAKTEEVPGDGDAEESVMTVKGWKFAQT